MTRRVACGVLAALAMAGVAGVVAAWQMVSAGEVAWSGREPGEGALTAYAVMQLSWGLLAPAGAMLAAASALALIAVGAREVAVRWSAVAATGVRALGSERSADDERARLDVERRADD